MLNILYTKSQFRFGLGIMFLAGYGTGAVMAVPCGDERDYALLTSLKDKNAGNKNIFSMLIFPKKPTVLKTM
jgi:leucyl-tRNA synthetase